MGKSKNLAVNADAADNYLGNDGIIQTGGQRLSQSVTIDSDTNGLMIGPITVDSDISITINGNLTVV